MLTASIGDQVQRAFAVFFAWLPHLVGALVALVVGYFLAKIVGNLVAKVLRRVGLDRAVHGNTGGNFVRRVVPSPSRLLGTITFWAIFLSAISLAVSVLGVGALQDFVASVWAYLPNVLAAVLIFLVAGALAAGITGLVTRVMGDTPLGKIVATAAPVLIMTIATFMILDQLQIAHNIVVITYAALLGAVALGSALAFGLGGRAVAERMLEGAYQTTQQNKDQWRRDLDQGMTRARSEASSMRDQMNDGGSETPRRRDEATARTRVATSMGNTPGESAYESTWEDPTERS